MSSINPQQPARGLQRDVIVHAGACRSPHRHEIGYRHLARGGRKGRPQDVGARQVGARGRRFEVVSDGRHGQKPALAGVQQPAEHRIAGETSQTAPIHTALPRNQRRTVTIADQGVVANRGIGRIKRHRLGEVRRRSVRSSRRTSPRHLVGPLRQSSVDVRSILAFVLRGSRDRNRRAWNGPANAPDLRCSRVDLPGLS